MPPLVDPLAAFHPLIRDWFREAIGQPTEVQALSWPKISAGEHVLISAPTGSGKTLTAFLWALQQLLAGQWPAGRVRVLYVSPLRALNTDIRQNLERPLEELSERFRAAGVEVPGIRAMTRSGDTPPAERQRMLRRPPEILITTPESLNILLTSQGGRSLLTGLQTVILDEIHAVAASKRGTHLITAIERLVPLSGEFQRVALSATIRPMEVIAEFIGGWQMRQTEGGVTYSKRPVTQVRSRTAKRYTVRVRHPTGRAGVEVDEDSLWEQLTDDFRKVILRNRSTLLFANSRRTTEKVTRLINDGAREDLAYSHHGSLSREVRAVVEERLKNGELKAIVATSSLELGIDIGALDEVVLIQTPRAISSAVQRVGRAGHGVGEVSRGIFYPTHGRDFLDAAIVAKSILEQDIEAVRPIREPLDVLAQVVLSMVVAETWNIDELYAALCTSYPYRHLKRRQLDLVIDMLTGRYADSRIRDLRPRASHDRINNTLKARRGAARLLYMAGGTIADRGYFALRIEGSMAKIGELDEEFVWERSAGDTFTLGAQSWQVRKITHNDVLVVPARRGSAMAPFWRADAQDRDHFFSRKIARFLASAEDRLDDPEFAVTLRRDYHLEPAAAEELIAFLSSQKAAIGRLPNTARLVIEHTGGAPGEPGQEQLIFHTFWGGSVNRPLVIALQAAWAERGEGPFEAFQDDDCILLRVPQGGEAREILSLVSPDQVESLLRRRLEQTGFFGSRFRVNASTALLLPRSGFRKRTPLWMHRQRSKKLLEAVTPYGDFPIQVETWRTCLQDDLDLENLKLVLRQVEEGEIDLEEVRTQSPSPFAANLIWRHTNHYMYADDSSEAAGASNLRQDLLKELVFQSHLRPRLPRQLVEQFRNKIQRTARGYAPHPGDDLVDWLRERVLVPAEEWRRLVAAISRDHHLEASEVVLSVAQQAARMTLPGAESEGFVALDSLPRWLRALNVDLARLNPRSVVPGGGEVPKEAMAGLRRLLASGNGARSVAADDSAIGDRAAGAVTRQAALADLVGEWAVFEGPFEPAVLHRIFGLAASAQRELIALLDESQRIVVDQLIQDSKGLEICDTENLEILLRWLRTANRPSFEVLPAEALPLFLATHQGLTDRGGSVEELQDRIEKLFGYAAPAAIWEMEILPARLDPYYPSWLDSLMQESELAWFGCGNARSIFAFPADLELFLEPSVEEPRDEAFEALFSGRPGKADLVELAERSGRPTGELSTELWRWTWEGRVANDSYVALRKGIETKFQAVQPAASHAMLRSRRRSSFDRWQASRPYFGHWFAVEPPTAPQDALEKDELTKDRIRVLLQRYGVLFRELLQREATPLQWSRIFRTLRLMELSGEVLAGHFFAGARGLQFISHAAFRELRQGLPEDAIYWLSAADPASLAGVDVEGLKGSLPARLASNHLVYHGSRLVLVSKRRGRELEVRCGADHPHLEDYLGIFKVLLTRQFQPLTSVDIETINGEPASESPLRGKMAEIFRLTREPRSVKLWKRY